MSYTIARNVEIGGTQKWPEWIDPRSRNLSCERHHLQCWMNRVRRASDSRGRFQRRLVTTQSLRYWH